MGQQRVLHGSERNAVAGGVAADHLATASASALAAMATSLLHEREARPRGAPCATDCAHSQGCENRYFYGCEAEVPSAVAIGFKVRPLTVEANGLAGTLRAMLEAQGGVVLVINRQDKLAQAVSLYRRRFEGRAGQFIPRPRPPAQEQVLAKARLAEEHRMPEDLSSAASFMASTTWAVSSADEQGGRPPSTQAAPLGGGSDGPGGNPWAAARLSTPHAFAKSNISKADLSKMLDHRMAQQASQPVSQSVSQPVSQSVSQPVSQSASQPASQPVSQSASQPVRTT